jgi:hypothetical protein
MLFVNKNTPFKYINPTTETNEKFIDTYLIIDDKYSHISKEIKDYYTQNNVFNEKKLFKDTINIIQQNIKQKQHPFNNQKK